MAFNSKYMRRASEKLEEIQKNNISEHGRRLKVIYSKIPEIKEIDYNLKAQMPELAKLMISKSPDIAEQIEKIRDRNLDLQMKRSELLVENGYPSDYLDELYNCPLCNDTGRDSTGRPCECLKKLYNAELTKDLSTLLKNGNESFENFDLAFYSDQYSEEFGCIPREQMESVYKVCRKFAANFPDVHSNLMLCGNPGLGKTFLSACIGREVAEKGFSVFYESAATALGAFEKQQFSKDVSEQEQASAVVKELLDCDLLILDDLGTEFATPAVITALYTLINSRLNRSRAMVISTNMQPDDFKIRYTPAIASRLNYDFLTLFFAGNDIRAVLKHR